MTTRLASSFLAQRVFTLDEVKTRHALSDNAAWHAVLYAKRRGEVGAVRKGLYYVVPPGADAATYRPDPYLVATRAAPNGVLVYHAALDLHGVAYSAFNEVAVAVPTWKRGFSFGGVRVRFVEAPTAFGVQKMTREGSEVLVTDRERTVVDGCDRPGHMGGLDEFLRSLANFPSIDHARVLRYIRRYGRKSLAAKVGWMLSRFRQQWGFPEDIENALQSLRPRGKVVLEPAQRRRLDSEWGVLYPSGLDQRLIEV